MIAFALALAQTVGSWVRVPSATYVVGEKGNLQNPLRRVKLASFEIAKFETTNAEFEAFVRATGYKTVAEANHNAMVFQPGLPEFRWIQDKTATFRKPNGASRAVPEDWDKHPVTTICLDDALAYCKWAGVRLCTFDEWEVAARAGTTSRYFWGNSPGEVTQYANVWHGQNHLKPDTSDGYLTTAPVGSFKPNPWGIYDIYGNVFELCTGSLSKDKGRRVAHARGGSWWCSQSSCCFFNSVDIGSVNPRASFSNMGFRVVRTPR